MKRHFKLNVLRSVTSVRKCKPNHCEPCKYIKLNIKFIIILGQVLQCCTVAVKRNIAKLLFSCKLLPCLPACIHMVPTSVQLVCLPYKKWHDMLQRQKVLRTPFCHLITRRYTACKHKIIVHTKKTNNNLKLLHTDNKKYFFC